MQTRLPAGSERRPSSAAVYSMRLFVVCASPPESSTGVAASAPTTIAAQPPGPGLPRQAPSVQTSGLARAGLDGRLGRVRAAAAPRVRARQARRAMLRGPPDGTAAPGLRPPPRRRAAGRGAVPGPPCARTRAVDYPYLAADPHALARQRRLRARQQRRLLRVLRHRHQHVPDRRGRPRHRRRAGDRAVRGIALQVPAAFHVPGDRPCRRCASGELRHASGVRYEIGALRRRRRRAPPPRGWFVHVFVDRERAGRSRSRRRCAPPWSGW